MFRPHFLSHDQVKVKFYKMYNNKLNKIKELAKRNFSPPNSILTKKTLK